MSLTDAQRRGVMSSASNEWGTPQWLFDELDREFHFDLDPCATPDNAKCERYFTESEDGLAQEWEGAVFMNPPYGRAIGDWVRKAYESSKEGAIVVCLIPARTDTSWWHRFVMGASEIRFIRGRVRFVGATYDNAPFPSVVVVFRPSPKALVLRQTHGQMGLLDDATSSPASPALPTHEPHRTDTGGKRT